MCGSVTYSITIRPSNGVIIIRITETFYNFTGLTPDTNYTVTVTGTNMAGVGDSIMETFMYKLAMRENTSSGKILSSIKVNIADTILILGTYRLLASINKISYQHNLGRVCQVLFEKGNYVHNCTTS